MIKYVELLVIACISFKTTILCSCPTDWNNYITQPSICYHFVSSKLSWQEASQTCSNNFSGSTLPAFRDTAEYESFHEFAKNDGKMLCTDFTWLGLKYYYASNASIWSGDLSSSIKEFWATNEPSNYGICVQQFGWGGFWMTQSCNASGGNYSFYCQLRINAAITTTAETETPAVTSCLNCPTNWVLDDSGICYLYNSDNVKNWTLAKDYCENILPESTLPIFRNATESYTYMKLLERLMLPCVYIQWLAMNDIGQEGNFLWTDASVPTFYQWSQTAPSTTTTKNCVCSSGWLNLNNSWSDTPCFRQLSFLCQFRLHHKNCSTTSSTVSTTSLNSVTSTAVLSSSVEATTTISNTKIQTSSTVGTLIQQGISAVTVDLALSSASNHSSVLPTVISIQPFSETTVSNSRNFEVSTGSHSATDTSSETSTAISTTLSTASLNSVISTGVVVSSSVEATTTISHTTLQISSTLGSLLSSQLTSADTMVDQTSESANNHSPVFPTVITTQRFSETAGKASSEIFTTTSSMNWLSVITQSLSTLDTSTVSYSTLINLILHSTSGQRFSDKIIGETTSSMLLDLFSVESKTSSTQNKEMTTTENVYNALITTVNSNYYNQTILQTNTLTMGNTSTATVYPVPKILKQIGLSDGYQTDPLATNAVVQDSQPFLTAPLNDSVKRDLGQQFDDMIISCVYSDQSCNNPDDFVQSWNPLLGNCYTFNGGKASKYDVTEAGEPYGLRVILHSAQADYLCSSLSAGFKIAIHQNNRISYPETEGYYLAPGTTSYFTMHQYQINRLNSPYGDCANSVLSTFAENYTVEDCQRNCFQNHLTKSCRCSDPRYPKVDKNSEYCTIQQKDCLDYNHQCEDTILKSCLCPPLCSETLYEVTATASKFRSIDLTGAAGDSQFRSNSSKRDKFQQDYTMIYVYYDTLNVIAFSETPSYPITSILADFSGVTGLLLGLCAVSIFEFALFAMTMFYGFVNCVT